MLLKNKRILVFSVIVIAIIIIYFLWTNYIQEKNVENNAYDGCLGENRTVNYEIKERESPLADMTVYINDKNTKRELLSFEISDLFKTSTSIELRDCGIYVIKFSNYDPKKSKQEPNFKAELRQYQYNGQVKDSIILTDFSYDFRVSPNEKYIVLEKGYLGKEDYALVIKDLKTKEDVFTLLANSISAKYPKVIGVFNMLKWSDNSRYFWGSIFDGAYVNGYFRIDTQDWKTNVFEAPDGAMGGSDLNINTGYITIQPGQVWSGFADIDEELKEQYQKEGRKSSLYIYNLFTKEKTLVAETDEPLWWFESEWLSETELQYKMPDGEKKIYKLKF